MADDQATRRPLSDKETNDLVGKIQSVLTPDLLKPKYRKMSEGEHPTFGHCGSATQAAYYMLGGEESGYVPQVANLGDGTTHWWLRHRDTGHVIDPTKEQYTSKGEKPPYDLGRGCGFPNPNPDVPSKRGQEIINRIRGRSARASGGSVDESDIASPPPAEETGIDAYHSSPHKFDKFDISKMGSGEGNQTFGPGLYFAENPKVSGQGGEYWRTFINRMKATPERHASFAMMSAGWNKEEAIKRLEKQRDIHLDYGIPGKYGNGPEVEEGSRLLAKEYDDAANLLRSEQPIAPHTYEVRINANPNHFLDWDHPLKNQSDFVKNAISNLMKKLNDKGINAIQLSGNVVWSDWVTRRASPMIIDEMDGAAIKSMLEKGFGRNIDKELSDSGLKGIRYFDARSREKKRGTRNYVVFDDKLIDIKRRYEMGGAVPMASGGETGDTQTMPQGISPEQQSLLDQLSRAIDESVARYSDGHAGNSASPARGYQEPTMPGEPSLTRQQEQDYNINRLQDALNRVPAAAHGGAMGYAEGGDVENNPVVQKALSLTSGNAPAKDVESQIRNTENPKRILVPATGPGKIKGIVIPRHMWEGGNGKHGLIPGMRDINRARASVYGSENRDPLTIGKVADIHKDALDEHFKLPINEQISRENAALERLRSAMHIGKSADTLDESEKLDTVRHEYDDEGRSHVAYGSKGIAGHALYTSGTGENQKFHVLNVCPGQTTGCGGGVDENGIVDTKRGTCFAPNAEAQYPGAAIRRACHTQAKFDPAMTRDWIIAHAGSLRRAAERADANGERVLFRPNVVDESDRSTRYAIKHLNDQREEYSKKNKLKVPLPDIIANSYGKTTEMHDPENGIFVTYSNTGPKTKLGQSVSENASRDNSRIRQTILAQDAAGRDLVNDDGEETPPKGSYMVTDVYRGSELDKRMQKAFKYAKYWSAGKPVSRLSKEEIAEGEEGHFGKDGKPTTPEKAHYGHVTLNGVRYDYQKQHILHPRLVQVGKNKDGTPHMIPTDSRFMDEKFLPKNRFVGKSGKKVGAILLTTPTTSTSSAGHQTSFTHHVGEEHIKHALANNGEYEIDPPAAQQAAAGKEYVAPKEKAYFAHGGAVGSLDDLASGEEEMCFPERSNYAQVNNVHRSKHEDDRELEGNRSRGVKSIDRALRLTSQYNQPTRGRP